MTHIYMTVCIITHSHMCDMYMSYYTHRSTSYVFFETHIKHINSMRYVHVWYVYGDMCMIHYTHSSTSCVFGVTHITHINSMRYVLVSYVYGSDMCMSHYTHRSTSYVFAVTHIMHINSARYVHVWYVYGDMCVWVICVWVIIHIDAHKVYQFYALCTCVICIRRYVLSYYTHRSTSFLFGVTHIMYINSMRYVHVWYVYGGSHYTHSSTSFVSSVTHINSVRHVHGDMYMSYYTHSSTSVVLRGTHIWVWHQRQKVIFFRLKGVMLWG